MTENTASAADERRKGSTEPGLEGEGGQYEEGDYGEAGSVGARRPARGRATIPKVTTARPALWTAAREVEVDEDRNPVPRSSRPPFTHSELLPAKRHFAPETPEIRGIPAGSPDLKIQS